MKVKFLISSIGSIWLAIKKKKNIKKLSFQSGERTGYPDKKKKKKGLSSSSQKDNNKSMKHHF